MDKCKVSILLVILVGSVIFYREKSESFSTLGDCRTMRYYGSNPGNKEYDLLEPSYSNKYREVEKRILINR
jgi:hypothetical protein